MQFFEHCPAAVLFLFRQMPLALMCANTSHPSREPKARAKVNNGHLLSCIIPPILIFPLPWLLYCAEGAQSHLSVLVLEE